MGSLAGARRTQSSFPTFLASTNPSTLGMAVYNQIGAPGASIATAIAHLADVAHVRTLSAGPAVPLNSKGAPRLSTVNLVVVGGSTDGYLTQQDRLAVLAGHLADPAHVNQIVITPGVERIWGVRLGSVVPIGFYAPSQATLPGFGTAKVKPRFTIDAHIVGIVAQSSEIVQDDVDKAYGFVFISPALVKKAATIGPSWSLPVEYEIQLRDGDAHLGRIEHELSALVPVGFTYEFHVTAHVESDRRTGAQARVGGPGRLRRHRGSGLPPALDAGDLSPRSPRRERSTHPARRGCGSPRVAPGDSGGSRRECGGRYPACARRRARALAPRAARTGATRLSGSRRFLRRDRARGGCPRLTCGARRVLGRESRSSAPRTETAASTRGEPPRWWYGALRSLSLPTAVTLGAHFALEPRGGSDDVPVRSVLFGSILAVALMATTLTFASGLNTLVSRPALYGWNWSYALNPTNDVPPSAIARLNHDHDVAAWSGADYTDVTVDGQSVPVLIASAKAKVMPPILSGHGLETNSQIVLGNQTMAVLHRHIGQTVTVSYGSPKNAPVYVPPTTLTIVGTATFPAVGYATSVADHTSMGTGALLPLGVEPPASCGPFRARTPT